MNLLTYLRTHHLNRAAHGPLLTKGGSMTACSLPGTDPLEFLSLRLTLCLVLGIGPPLIHLHLLHHLELRLLLQLLSVQHLLVGIHSVSEIGEMKGGL